MIKGSIQEKDITIVNIYAPNIGPPQYTNITPRKIIKLHRKKLKHEEQRQTTKQPEKQQ